MTGVKNPRPRCNWCPRTIANVEGECFGQTEEYCCECNAKGNKDCIILALTGKKMDHVDLPTQVVKKEGPSLIQKGVNFTGAIFHHILDHMQKVSEEVKAERLNICENCDEYFDKEKRVCNHVECGCFVDAKVKWASESCPIKKWVAVAQSKSGCGGCGSKVKL